jgi:hypothetical protein
MIRVIELSKNPATFMRTTGINYGAFEIILTKVGEYISQYKEAHPIHKRGRKPLEMDTSQWLLLTLLYMRQYHTFLSLGQAFSISESYAYKRYVRMRSILAQVLDMPSKGLLDSATLNKISVDVSEQPIERPQHKQKRYYSGKKKAHHKSPDGGLPFNRPDPKRLLW